MTQSQRNALIVGASRGLGLGLVETFLERGRQVTATQRSPSPDLAGLDAKSLRVGTADIDDDAGVAALHDRLADQRFDLIFVVAGVATQAHDPLHAVPREVAAQAYLTNAISPMRFAEAFLNRLAPGGSLALMSSILGSVSLNASGG
ncbi:short chain dehydrogenase [Methylobacterium brachiatum]|nr:short chain dehydrogenase [Methylobacterium brachiatum]